MSDNVVPPIERASIVAEAKQEAMSEVIRRSKTIDELPETTTIENKKIELNTGESISIETIAKGISDINGPFWED